MCDKFTNTYAILEETINKGNGDLISTETLFHMCWSYAVDSPEYNKKYGRNLKNE